MPGLLHAADKRSLPLDLFLIVDGSSMLANDKNDAISWLSREFIDRILVEGDTLNIWSAGDKARLVYTETIGAKKDAAKDTLKTLSTSGKSSDFIGALREAAAKAGPQDGKRLKVTLLVTGSAEAFAPALEGAGASLLRWSRFEESSRWQALMVAPGIGDKVRRAAAAYMSGV
ncbi:hypothetical protein TREAZ_3336 [Leadbettera azotonutricia ZAS-9]|uniref:VWFA domain-containing protein n=2 Tax=Leadbettera azotonutricia TaxID=150829 RepID=F5Y8I3_LEAAZ|nr:hypothetical protein TREAZ_3336 [Leadbettera azotonutricia ZAS-9]